MRVLVTGANGLIGPYACRTLKSAGNEVMTCGRSEIMPGISDHHITGDLLDAAFRSSLLNETRPTKLIHLAWQTKHGHFWNAPDNPDWRLASIDLLNRFLDLGGTRAVLAGSCAEYDWLNVGVGEKLSEAASCVPATLYGQEKLKLSEYCNALNAQGASVAWGRLFLLCGPRENTARFVPSITRALLDDDEAKMSSGNQVRDFMHVEDAGNAFASILDSDFRGTLNVASGKGASLLSVANQLHQLIGRGTLSPGSFPDRPDDPPYLMANTSILDQTIGFKPKHDLTSALDNCVKWWSNHNLCS